MKIELKTMVIYEAYDNREWGSSWGYFTTEEEARESVKENQTEWTRGTVRKKILEVPKS